MRDLAFGSGRDERRPDRFGSELARAVHWNDLQEQSSYKGFLILHRTVWLTLAAGMATNKRWSYRAAIALFTGFAIYQIYRLVQQNAYSLGLSVPHRVLKRNRPTGRGGFWG